MGKHLTGLLALCSAVAAIAREDCYIFGADITWNHADIERGRTYSDNGEQKELLNIFKEHGFNWIRLRMFVDPTAVVPETDESPYSTQGYADLEHTIDMATYVKEAGFKFLLDFHYSDIWADPGKQYKPMSWRDLSYTELVEQVRTYTRESLEAFEEAGVLPEMVQVGNEIVNGMIWPDGRDDNMRQFAELVNAGIDGVKDVSEDIVVMVHSISSSSPSNWLRDLINAGVDRDRLDVYGLSYYEEWHGTPDDLQRNLSSVTANHDIPINVVEYADNHRRVNDIVFNLPDEQGVGSFIWEPSRWMDALFDGGATNERMDLFPEMVTDYGNDTCSESTPIAKRPDTKAPRTAWFDGSGRLHFNHPLPADAAVSLFTLEGKWVGKLKMDAAGTATLSSLSLQNGIYFIKVSGISDKILVKSARFGFGNPKNNI